LFVTDRRVGAGAGKAEGPGRDGACCHDNEASQGCEYVHQQPVEVCECTGRHPTWPDEV